MSQRPQADPSEAPLRLGDLRGAADARGIGNSGGSSFQSGPTDPSGRPLPGWRDSGLWLVLAIAAVFLSIAWYRERGPQIADSIEYMERANALARGEQLIDSKAIRAFGFSGLLLPIFAIARWLDVRDFTHVMQACQVLQLGFSLALIALAARLCARVAGREAGLAAALLVGLNPTLLRWGAEPVSGVAAGLFVALGVAKLFDERTLRSGVVAGAWLGLGILMAYQTFSVVGVIVAFVALRNARPARAHTLGLALGVLALILVQCTLDLFYYGGFAVSVTSYLYQNFGVQLARVMVEIGKLLHSDRIVEASRWLYNQAVELEKLDPEFRKHAAEYQTKVKQATAEIKQIRSLTWYFQNISAGLPWAALALVALGVLRAFALRSWKVWLAVVVVVANASAYGLKGSQDFRLWLPFLALIALLGGIGWSTLAGAARRTSLLGFARVLAALAILAAAGVYGVRENWSTNTRKFGGYWDAIDFVNRRTADEYAQKPIPPGADQAPRDRVSCAYHWAVFLRSAEAVDLIKLPHHLDFWNAYSPEERAADLETIAGLDWFITHLPVLTLFPEVMEVVNREFSIEAVYFDRLEYAGLGPIYVLRKKRGASDERCFYERFENRDLDGFARERKLDPARTVRWCEDTATGRVTRLTLLDWKYEPVAGDGFGWITYTWHGGGFGERNYWFVDHLTSDRLDTSWDNDHYPAYGMHATSTWGEGWILREGYLVIPENDPFRAGGPTRWFGGENRRGDLIPATLWMDVAGLDEQHEPVERLESCDEHGDYLGARALRGRPPLPRGECLSDGGWTRVGRLWVPVHPDARYPDDGTPVPAEQ